MIKYVIETLVRHRSRSWLTVTRAAVAMFVFCIVGSVQEGLNRLTTGSDADRSLVVFQENRFCPTTSRLPEDGADPIKIQSMRPLKLVSGNWSHSSIRILNYLPVHMANLRRKIEQDSVKPQHILTEQGVGYRLATEYD